MQDPLDIDELKRALPASARKAVSTEVLNNINKTLTEPDMYEAYRENLLSYANVLKDGRFKLTSYISAIKFCSYRLCDKSIKDAFNLTFPEKLRDWLARGIPEKDQASYRTAFNKSKLVTLIMEQAMIPTHILNQDIFQKAVNVQAELMMTAKSEKVKSDAANSLMHHLKPPEAKEISLKIGTGESSVLAALREQTEALAKQQRAMIEQGNLKAKDVSNSSLLIEHEVNE